VLSTTDEVEYCPKPYHFHWGLGVKIA